MGLAEPGAGDQQHRVGYRQPTDLDLWGDVAELPPKQRAAIAYHYLADLPYAQVAELLDSTEAAARRAAADGIAKLRVTLGREDRP